MISSRREVDSMTVGNRLAIIMQDANMKQAEFGEALKISQSAINRLVNDGQPIREATLELLSLKFNVNSEWLLTGKGEKYNTGITDSLTDVLKDYPAVMKAIRTASAKMSKKDWQKLNEILEALEGDE